MRASSANCLQMLTRTTQAMPSLLPSAERLIAPWRLEFQGDGLPVRLAAGLVVPKEATYPAQFRLLLGSSRQMVERELITKFSSRSLGQRWRLGHPTVRTNITSPRRSLEKTRPETWRLPARAAERPGQEVSRLRQSRLPEAHHLSCQLRNHPPLR